MTHGPPDQLFVGGRIVTQTSDARRAHVVTVTDGIVTALGGAEVLDLRGTRSEIVDIGAGALLPGFVDAHIYALTGGLTQRGSDLSTVR